MPNSSDTLLFSSTTDTPEQIDEGLGLPPGTTAAANAPAMVAIPAAEAMDPVAAAFAKAAELEAAKKADDELKAQPPAAVELAAAVAAEPAKPKKTPAQQRDEALAAQRVVEAERASEAVPGKRFWHSVRDGESQGGCHQSVMCGRCGRGDERMSAGQRVRTSKAERAAFSSIFEQCLEPFRGRQDKRFCRDACRTRFGRQRKAREVQEAIARLARLTGVKGP